MSRTTQPSTHLERITPKQARIWLEAMHARQRPVAASRVNVYAADMKTGRWLQTGESIKFDREGDLLDGQHRLRAIIEAGVTIEMLVIRGLPRESFKAIDTGKVRSGGDALVIEGIDGGVAKIAATASSLSQQYGAGLIPGSRGGMQGRVSNSDLIEFIRENPAILDAARFVHTHAGKAMPMSEAQMTWACFEARQVDETAADLFILDLITGSGLVGNDPVLALREMLLANRTARRKLDLTLILAAVVKAWNKRRKGARMGGFNTLTRKDWQQFPRFE